jgi:ribosomal protein S18 acetylase RimI-like enzyme
MVEIERLTASQWDRLRALRLRALDDAPDAFWVTLDQEAATTPAEWRRRLEATDTATFVALDAGRDVGMVMGSPHYEDEQDAGLYSLWVAPEARGRGVGQALINTVIQWARDAGYQTLRLEVGDRNRGAVDLYDRMGFKPSGLTAVFPPPRDHITEHERVLNLLPEATASASGNY